MTDFQLDFITLFETRISGCKVENLLVKLRFEYSFKVEVERFAGGIWLFWNEGTSMEVLEIHP